jgi:hypothetical protein
VGSLGRAQGFGNKLKHAIHIGHHIVIGNMDGAVTVPSQRGVANPVFCFLVRVAIDLDDQLHGRASEICYVPTNYLLAPELVSLKLAVRQMPPQPLFRFRRIVAHVARSGLQLFDGRGR